MNSLPTDSEFSSPFMRGVIEYLDKVYEYWLNGVLVPFSAGWLSNPFEFEAPEEFEFVFSSPFMRGGYRINKSTQKRKMLNQVLVPFSAGWLSNHSSLKPITPIVRRQNLLSKIVTNHLYYRR